MFYLCGHSHLFVGAVQVPLSISLHSYRKKQHAKCRRLKSVLVGELDAGSPGQAVRLSLTGVVLTIYLCCVYQTASQRGPCEDDGLVSVSSQHHVSRNSMNCP